MNGLPYYKAYPRDFLEGTIGMPFEIKAAYRLLLDLIYMQGGRLPDDGRYISGHMGLSIRKWNSIRSELLSRGKIEIIGEFISNYRADKEIETLRKYQYNQAEKAARPRKNNDLANATAKPARVKPEPEPYISSSLRSEDKRTPRDELETVLSPESAKAVVEHRKALKKPLSVRAAQLLAAKFKLTDNPDASADAMIANGWQGFEPEWLENRKQASGRSPPSQTNDQPETDLQRLNRMSREMMQ